MSESLDHTLESDEELLSQLSAKAALDESEFNTLEELLKAILIHRYKNNEAEMARATRTH